jgi:menaquinone-9 beta-reductase
MVIDRVARSLHDVIVVGAGPSGSATAARLAAAGWDVQVFDRARFPRPKPCAEYLSPGTVAALRKVGVFERLAPDAGCAMRGMEICAPGGQRYLVEYRDDQTPMGRDYSLAVARETLDTTLVEVARSCGASVAEGVTVTDLTVERGAVCGAVGRTATGHTWDARARLVIGADGAHSVVSRRLGLQLPRRWPHRLGLVAHLRDVIWPHAWGEMHVGPHGYVGVAPLAESCLSVGLVMPMPNGRLGPPRQALEAALATYPRLMASLQSAGYRGADQLARVRGVGPLAHAVRAQAGPGFALVGDAAGFLDPFTGEGIFRALRGAEVLAPLADAALRRRGDQVRIGAAYAQARRTAFRGKERLTALIQAFVHVPRLMNLAVDRLCRRPRLGAQLARVLGDLDPADQVLNGRFLCALLLP